MPGRYHVRVQTVRAQGHPNINSRGLSRDRLLTAIPLVEEKVGLVAWWSAGWWFNSFLGAAAALGPAASPDFQCSVSRCQGGTAGGS